MKKVHKILLFSFINVSLILIGIFTKNLFFILMTGYIMVGESLYCSFSSYKKGNNTKGIIAFTSSFILLIFVVYIHIFFSCSPKIINQQN